MQPALRSSIPDASLAVFPVNGENSHQGLAGRNPALYPGHEACNFTVLLGMRGQAELNRVGPRSSGKERDSESGNDYFGARYYSSSVGRFMSPDWSVQVEPVPYAELGDPQSLNLYAYVANNPLKARDADGHELVPLPGASNPVQAQQIAFAMGLTNFTILSSSQLAQQQAGELTLPNDPSGLGPEWTPDPTHTPPNGSRWNGPGGIGLDFDQGQPGKKGWRGKDHWHIVTSPGQDGKRVRGEEHLPPGTKIPIPMPPVEPLPEDNGPSRLEQLRDNIRDFIQNPPKVTPMPGPFGPLPFPPPIPIPF